MADGRDVPDATFACPDLTTFTRLDELRLDWLKAWGERAPDLPGMTVSKQSVRRQLLRLAQRAEHAVLNESRPQRYGPRMCALIEEKIGQSVFADLPFVGDQELVLGGVFALVSECRVWVSPPFDVAWEQEQAKRSLSAGGGMP